MRKVIDREKRNKALNEVKPRKFTEFSGDASHAKEAPLCHKMQNHVCE